jgi:hypothetical protein
MFSINEYIISNRQGRYTSPIHCKDGFSMSVQASRRHYCIPMVNEPENGYSHVEVGYPSERVSLLQRYAEKDLSGCNTGIYNRVPAEIVNQIVEDHGGIAD